MDINQAFPSKYLKAADFHGPLIVTITHLTMEDVDGDMKPCVFFQGNPKGLILNKTNGNEISYMHGSETDAWTGRQIEVYPTETDYQGKRVPCIRVRVPNVNVGSPGRSQEQPAQGQTTTPQTGNFDPNTPPNDGWPGQ